MTSEFLESLPSSIEVAEFCANHTKGCAPLPAISMGHIRQWAIANGVQTKTDHEAILVDVTRSVNRFISAAALLPEDSLTAEKWLRYVKPLCPRLLYRMHSKSVKRIGRLLCIQSAHIEGLLGGSATPIKSASAIRGHSSFRLTLEAWELRSERHIGQMSFAVDVLDAGYGWMVINASA